MTTCSVSWANISMVHCCHMTSICTFTYNYTRHIHIKQIICIFSPILCLNIFKNLVWSKGNVENCSWRFIAHEIKSQADSVLLWDTVFCTVCSQILFHACIKSAVHVHFAAELVIATVSLSSKVILNRRTYRTYQPVCCTKKYKNIYRNDIIKYILKILFKNNIKSC